MKARNFRLGLKQEWEQAPSAPWHWTFVQILDAGDPSYRLWFLPPTPTLLQDSSFTYVGIGGWNKHTELMEVPNGKKPDRGKVADLQHCTGEYTTLSQLLQVTDILICFGNKHSAWFIIVAPLSYRPHTRALGICSTIERYRVYMHVVRMGHAGTGANCAVETQLWWIELIVFVRTTINK